MHVTTKITKCMRLVWWRHGIGGSMRYEIGGGMGLVEV